MKQVSLIAPAPHELSTGAPSTIPPDTAASRSERGSDQTLRSSPWWRRLVFTTHGQLLLLALALCLIASAVPVIKSTRAEQHTRDNTERKYNKDYSKWYDAALKVREGERLYTPTQKYFGDFIYPPSSAVVFYTPLSFGGRTVMVILLCGLTFIAHVVVVFASVYLARGGSGEVGSEGWTHQPLGAYLLPFIWTVPHVWDIYLLGQFNLVMLAMLMGGFVLLERATYTSKRPRSSAPSRIRQISSGMLISLAISAKAFPLPVVFYLAWRRAWLALLGILAGLLLVLLLIPGLVRGFDRHTQEMTIWVDRMILSTSSTQLSNQPWRSFRAGNQSLISVLTRFTRPTENPAWPTSNPREDFNVNLIDAGPRGSWTVVAIVAAGLLATYMLAMLRARHLERASPLAPSRERPTPLPPRYTLHRRGIEISILLLLVVLLSPKAGSYYFCWAIPGLAMAVSEWLDAPWGSQRKWFIGMGLTLSAAISALALGQALGWPVETYGATCFGNLILVLLLLALLAFPPSPATNPPRENVPLAIESAPRSS